MLPYETTCHGRKPLQRDMTRCRFNAILMSAEHVRYAPDRDKLTWPGRMSDREIDRKPERRRVLACRGWAGKNSDFFSILLVRRRQYRYDAQRPAGPACNLHRQGNHVESSIRQTSEIGKILEHRHVLREER